MSPVVAALLGLVEGLTEYLPVSSTGHLLLVTAWLERAGVSVAGADSFDIVIQLGAILAVVAAYRDLLGRHARGLAARRPDSIRLALALVVAFVPTAVVGLLFRKAIKRLLFGPTTIAVALVVGGVVMIVAERALGRRAERRAAAGRPLTTSAEDVSLPQAAIVGLGQIFALVPGTSRSMATILAGQAAGLTTAAAAELSFLIGLPTLGAATVYEGYKERHALLHDVGALNLAIGLGVSFLVAWAVVGGFVAWLKRHGLAPFGVYRVVLGVVVLATLAR